MKIEFTHHELEILRAGIDVVLDDLQKHKEKFKAQLGELCKYGIKNIPEEFSARLQAYDMACEEMESLKMKIGKENQNA